MPILDQDTESSRDHSSMARQPSQSRAGALGCCLSHHRVTDDHPALKYVIIKNNSMQHMQRACSHHLCANHEYILFHAILGMPLSSGHRLLCTEVEPEVQTGEETFPWSQASESRTGIGAGV